MHALKNAATSSRGSKKAALELKTVFQIVGGDNATESEVNRTKSQLRRTNALGRGSPANAHVDQLSARRLLKQPEFVECAQCHWQRQRK